MILLKGPVGNASICEDIYITISKLQNHGDRALKSVMVELDLTDADETTALDAVLDIHNSEENRNDFLFIPALTLKDSY